ncbi:hypothetical protein [Heyndrickxia oleronia]|uniref:hypothetical protein n=1 Tax=Heyndrickxia oleronia TaxID=38875 RepID=UPI001B2E296E|nr:hypothetical protein [Heyndrickxia oleronia]GIN39034.1 hypothetical protein J19TS1_19830 [Heyndrickxia oleronia]
MTNEFEMLNSKHTTGIQKLVNEYSLYVGDQKVGIKIYFDANGYYQMATSHFYKGEGKAGVYITSAANFESEKEALRNAKNQLLMFYDGKGEWRKNKYYSI